MDSRAAELMPRGALVVIESAPFFEFNTLWKIKEARNLGGAWEIAGWETSEVVKQAAVLPYESALVAISFGLGPDDWVDIYCFGRYFRNMQRYIDERKTRVRGSKP